MFEVVGLLKLVYEDLICTIMFEFLTLFYILLTLAIQSILLVRYFNEAFYSILFYSFLEIDPTGK